MNLLYHVGLSLYWLGIFVASFINQKAKKRIKGSASWRKQLKDLPSEKKRIWIHAASYGEFEQGRPVFDALCAQYPNHHIVLTFFSPSGFDAFRKYEGADTVLYLPFDFAWNSSAFVTYLQPEIAVFVKYDFWINYLTACGRAKIPVVYFSSVFRERQHFFKWYGNFFRSALRLVDHFFVQDFKSVELLGSAGIRHVSVIGDTRVDRVLKVREEEKSFSAIDRFKGKSTLLVAGSTWAEDDRLLAKWLDKAKGCKLIIAPHELSEQRLRALKQRFHNAGLWSTSDFERAQVLIIDEMGWLKYLYQFGDFCYVGGGFGKGIHNTLEALVWEKPVFFGPNYQKFEEAKDILRLEVGAVVQDSTDLYGQMNLFKQDRDTVAEQIQHYFNVKKGATSAVMSYLKKLLG